MYLCVGVGELPVRTAASDEISASADRFRVAFAGDDDSAAGGDDDGAMATTMAVVAMLLLTMLQGSGIAV